MAKMIFFLAICTTIHAFEGNDQKEWIKTYDGKIVSREKKEDEILVTAMGNLRTVGPYYLKEGTGLKFFYWICGGHGGQGDFGGGPPIHLNVTRVVDGKVENYKIKFRTLHLAETKDFKLMDGDIVRADERIF